MFPFLLENSSDSISRKFVIRAVEDNKDLQTVSSEKLNSLLIVVLVL
jgi:hypothetical protein